MKLPSWRKLLRTVHLWVAIVLCVPLVLIGLSGSALLVQREFLRLTGPAASTTGVNQPLERVVAAARAAVAPEARATWIDLPVSPGAVAVVQFEIGRRPARRIDVSVDPVSLAVVNTANYVRRGPVKTVFTDIHEFMMMPSHIGFPFVGWMGVALTFLGLSGLVLWWPRKGQWRSAFLVRRGARGLRLHLDLHHAVGIWGLLVLLTLSISGIYLIFPVTMTSLVKSVLPAEAPELDQTFASSLTGPIDHDQAVRVAQDAIANAIATGLQLPGAGGVPYVVQMEPAGLGPTVPAIMVTIDPQTAEISYVEDPRAQSAAEQALNLLHALHFGLGLGWVWGLLVFLSGLLPLFLAVTGLTIWWKSRRARAGRTVAAVAGE